MFRFEYMTQTQIGELFAVSSHQIGKWLVEIGLRTDGKSPSSMAFDGKYVTQTPSGEDHYNWVWHSARTVAALEQAGHRRIPNPPLFLADPPKLSGPFMTRENCHNGYDILNGDKSVAAVVFGRQNVELVAKVLNLAHQHGVIARHFGGSGACSVT